MVRGIGVARSPVLVLTLMEHPWRLTPELVAPGATQMAIDAWLLDQVVAGHQAPTLRFYRWSPAALSLGYHQKHWPDHWRTLVWQGRSVDLVRRPTGGRAVLHQGDLSYAIALPMPHDRRQDLYRELCEGLIAAWQRLGVPLSYGTAGRGYRHQPSCFAIATAADLVTPTGYKLIGSAQLRRDRCLLQHGTMRLWPDPVLYAQVFGEPMGTATPPAVIPPSPTAPWRQTLITLVVEELSRCLGVTFETVPLTDAELQEAQAQYAWVVS